VARSTFIKAHDTKVSVSNSRAELEKMLRRYGASTFHVSMDFAARRSSVSFVVPNGVGSAQVPVRLYVETERVARILFEKRSRFTEAQLEKAERVAWRNLVLWVDATLSAAAIGMQTVTEAFFAHAVVGPAGERMIELVEHAQQSLGAGVQRLLTAPAEAD
jgi:hypothetical protein